VLSFPSKAVSIVPHGLRQNIAGHSLRETGESPITNLFCQLWMRNSTVLPAADGRTPYRLDRYLSKSALRNCYFDWKSCGTSRQTTSLSAWRAANARP